jgi:hypothetical protein
LSVNKPRLPAADDGSVGVSFYPDIYLTATTTPTSNPATQHIDIYQGNSTLTLFEPGCPWISYREAFCLPDAEFVRLPESRSITGLSRLFFFDS